jgi:hypothetical protein
VGTIHECLTETSAVAAKQLRRGTTPIEPIEIASALAPLRPLSALEVMNRDKNF